MDESKGKWYACSYCHSKKVPSEEQIGDIFRDGELKPVTEWDMHQPKPLAVLRNRFETTQTALCGLFSTTVKHAGYSQWRHVQGEVNAVQKQERHFYGLFAFLACKEQDLRQQSKQPEASLRIHNALRCLRSHNHLYTDFFSNYETLFRYARPQFINRALLEAENMPLDRLLEDEAVGMAFPVDSRYFDNFALIFQSKDVTGVQHPQPGETKSRDVLHGLVSAKYGERYLEPKTFPHLHPWGFGGWYYPCPMGFSPHVKMRLFDVRGWWAMDSTYPFFKYDYMTKQRLRAYNQRHVVRVSQLTQQLQASTVREAESGADPNKMYGTEIPRNIPGSTQHWKSFGLDLTVFVSDRGLPDFFVTLTAHDKWLHVQCTIARGWGAEPTSEEYRDIVRNIADRQPVGWHPHICVMAAEKRFNWIMGILRSPDGPLSQVEDYCWKKEYQKRGAVHWHMLFWVKPGTAPEGIVLAEVPRGLDTAHPVAAYLRKVVLQMQMHGRCNPNRCFKGSYGKTLGNCKYGFPFPIPQNIEELDDEHIRYVYVRRCDEDKLVVPYNPELAVLWGASHNVQRVSQHGFEQYLAKCISKPEPSANIKLPENAPTTLKYLRTRVVGAYEAIEVLMGFHRSQMTRQAIYLPTELVPSQRMLKRKSDLDNLAEDSEDVYLHNRLDEYFQRPQELSALTYPEFYQWWRKGSNQEQKKGEDAAARGEQAALRPRGSDDFYEFQLVEKQIH